MKLFSSMLVLLAGLLSACTSQQKNDYFTPVADCQLRAPAYPLVTIDPYTSGWSFTDQLNADQTRHWTGKPFPLLGVLRVDGTNYRFMGKENIPLRPVLSTAKLEKWDASYTEKKPAANWFEATFNDASWKKGKAAFGTPEMPHLATTWQSEDIWVRRTFDLDEDVADQTVYPNYSHDDVFELYINGKQVVSTGNTWKNDVLLELPADVKASLRKGKNVIAAHCHNTTGGAYVDFGLSVKMPDAMFFETAADQTHVTFTPTQTYYTFACGPVALKVIFTAPLLMDDLDLMSRPVNYISYQVESADGKAHDVQLYLEATSAWATNVPGQAVESAVILKPEGLQYAMTGTVDQPVLQTKGDDVRIDWGHFYLAAPQKESATFGASDFMSLKKEFAAAGSISRGRNIDDPNQEHSLAMVDNLGSVKDAASGYAMIAYDDDYAIQYFNDNRMAYWKHNGQVSIDQVLLQASKDYDPVMQRCRTFDEQLMNDTRTAGGEQYAELCALVYRQILAAHKLVEDKNGNLLYFSKENFSNGSIGTVDITYPSSPLFLVYNPELLKGMMNFIFEYSESGRWQKPFAAHDVGTYPQANGQTYGGDMPVEESGNMLILTTAIALREGNADYAKKHWDVLTTWTNYLVEAGLDPENQLCTDDFAGHFAHNANLSIKAILGIAGYGKLAEMLGEQETADKYLKAAKEMAGKWKEMAIDGDHYKLTFDQPGTWSQKYNLIWDKLLGLNIFDKDIATTEMAYYKTVQNTYGLPLDSRKAYTKSDWIMWTACLTGKMDDFNALVAPVYKYANETPSRIPLSDWHETTDATSVGFRARSVVGGYFMKVLEQRMCPETSQPQPAQ